MNFWCEGCGKTLDVTATDDETLYCRDCAKERGIEITHESAGAAIHPITAEENKE